jgi:hypothetical protein
MDEGDGAAKSGRFPALALSRSGSKGISHPRNTQPEHSYEWFEAAHNAGPPRKQAKRYTALRRSGKREIARHVADAKRFARALI